ncbi:hypothetical protein DFH06DRAFT_1186769, partial [Mycena polygramma]
MQPTSSCNMRVCRVVFLVLGYAQCALSTGGANLTNSGLPPHECDAKSPQASCRNQTLLYSGNSELPEGTFIAASLTGALQLADYLDAHPTVNVTHLLISDSSMEDLATDFGYGVTNYDFLNFDPSNRAINKNISQSLEQVIIDLDTVSSRIMKRTSSLESLVYLTYIRIWDFGHSNVTDNRTRNVLDHDFPRLTHLTLRDTRWRFQDLPRRQTFFPALPSLTHLHVVSRNYPPLSTLRRSAPNATHVRFSGNLPKEYAPRQMFLVQWTKSFVGGLFKSANSPILIAQADFNPMLDPAAECATPGLQHYCTLSRLARNSELRLSLPAREDYDKYGETYDLSRLFPLSRAITEFEDRILGGEGEWAIPSKNETMEYATSSLRFC